MNLGLFKGRISRSTFWINSIIGLILSIIIIVLLSIFGVTAVTSLAGSSADGGVGMSILMFVVICIVAFVPGLVVSLSAVARRFHDRDKSGWWALIWFVPYLGFFWILIECGCLKGISGPNSFGPDPLTDI